jgi:cobalt-zinc-cadmium efflux system membrane fusion protein
MAADKKTVAIGVAAIAALLLAGGVYLLRDGRTPRPAAAERADAAAPADQPAAANTVELSETQLAFVKVATVGEHEFPIEKTAVGSIDFNEDMTVPVFTPYQGRIVGLFATVGDDVKKGQTLFTIDSPDLLQAESGLIAAAGVLQLTSKNLDRMRDLFTTHAVSQKDLEQAVSDQQSAEGALRAARDSVRLFGKTDAEIDRIIAERIADPKLVVPSPITGRITARNAAPGLFVQPGNPPAPYSVADITTMWMLANVAEADSPAFRVGQEVSDPQHQLRSGMFANFVIRTGEPARSPAVPHDGVVREGDGSMTVWVTTDREHFIKRTVTIGLQHDGFDQILTGLKAGELVATEGALFLSNALSTSSR